MSADDFRRAIRELWLLAEDKQIAKKNKMSTNGFRKALRSVWSFAEGAPDSADTSVFVRFGRSVDPVVVSLKQTFSLDA